MLRFVKPGFEGGVCWIIEQNLVEGQPAKCHEMKPVHVGQEFEFENEAQVLASYPEAFQEV